MMRSTYQWSRWESNPQTITILSRWPLYRVCVLDLSSSQPAAGSRQQATSNEETTDWNLLPAARCLLPADWHGRDSNPHYPRFELGRSADWRTVPGELQISDCKLQIELKSAICNLKSAMDRSVPDGI
jgi:hypothetical protein